MSEPTPAAPVPLKLYAALRTAQKSIEEAAKKDGKNQHHGYSYATAEEMITIARQALADAGLTAFRAEWHYTPSTADAPPMVECRMVLSHAESGEAQEYSYQWPAIPGQGRPLDKAIAAALTTSLAYWLRDVLLIPRSGEEIRMDMRDDRGYVPPPQLPPMPKKAAPHPAEIAPVTASARATTPAAAPAPDKPVAAAPQAAPSTAPAAEEPPVLRHMAPDADVESQADYERLITLQESEEIPRAVIERLAARNDMCKPGTPMHMLSKRALRALVENWPTVQRMAAKLK